MPGCRWLWRVRRGSIGQELGDSMEVRDSIGNGSGNGSGNGNGNGNGTVARMGQYCDLG